jgi:hypothetical protein
MTAPRYYGLRVGNDVLGPIPTAPAPKVLGDAECWHGTPGAARDYRCCSACVWLVLQATRRRG